MYYYMWVRSLFMKEMSKKYLAMFPIDIINDLTWEIAFVENVASSWRLE